MVPSAAGNDEVDEGVVVMNSNQMLEDVGANVLDYDEESKQTLEAVNFADVGDDAEDEIEQQQIEQEDLEDDVD